MKGVRVALATEAESRLLAAGRSREEESGVRNKEARRPVTGDGLAVERLGGCTK